MSSFAAANLIARAHRQWIEDNMEQNSFLLDLNGPWLCYLTPHDQDLSGYAFYGGEMDAIPQSVGAISQKVPVLYLNHPEDHGWACAVIDKGAPAGRLALDYEGGQATDENGLAALSLLDFTGEEIAALQFTPGSQDFGSLMDTCTALIQALQCGIDFISYAYVLDNPQYFNILARK